MRLMQSCGRIEISVYFYLFVLIFSLFGSETWVSFLLSANIVHLCSENLGLKLRLYTIL